MSPRIKNDRLGMITLCDHAFTHQCYGSALVSMWIRIQHLGQRGSGSGSRVLVTKNCKILRTTKKLIF
jgi:hypothetical protein